jgi:Resolvase, N terminal domain
MVSGLSSNSPNCVPTVAAMRIAIRQLLGAGGFSAMPYGERRARVSFSPKGRARVHIGNQAKARANTISRALTGRRRNLGVGASRHQQQDLTAKRSGLHALGVGDDRIYVDHGLPGTNPDRRGLRLALAACRAGDTSVVTRLDRLARSLPDALTFSTS